MKKPILRCLTMILAINLALVLCLFNFSANNRIYARNLLFSKIYADSEITKESELDEHIFQGFKQDEVPDNYLPFLNIEKAKRLKSMASRAGFADVELAEEIGRSLGDLTDSKVCGIESLGRVVFDVERGLGCCSDISKAWIFYAVYAGLKVREVSLFNHTTVEFFDRQLGQWIWLDPMNRVKFNSSAGAPLSQYKIRQGNFFEPRIVKKIGPEGKIFHTHTYIGYQPTQYSAVMWSKSINFLELEKWHARLSMLGMSKSARQFILLSTGIHPGWLMLATDPIASYLKALKFGILVFALFLGTVQIIVLVHCIRTIRLKALPQR